MEPHSFTNLGGNEKPDDERDLSLGAVTSPHYTFPPTFTNEAAWAADVEYQGQQPACGAHSGSKYVTITRPQHVRTSPRFTWADLKTFDGWALTDGTDIRSIMKSLQKSGASDFLYVKNDVSLSLEQYAHPTISQEARADGLKRKTGAYGFRGNDTSFNALKQLISDRGAVVILMRVTERFWTDKHGKTSWKEKDILPLAPASSEFPVVSGHFVVGHSYDENYIYFINSFGPTWGRKGHGYFGADYMPMINDWATVVPAAFSKDLYYGMTDPEVVYLQRFFNSNPQTRVATTGPGSPGQETDYFGNLTRNAAIRFQNLHGIKPNAGYVGPVTRAIINTLT